MALMVVFFTAQNTARLYRDERISGAVMKTAEESSAE